MEGRIW